jgi:hypothetical protein
MHISPWQTEESFWFRLAANGVGRRGLEAYLGFLEEAEALSLQGLGSLPVDAAIHRIPKRRHCVRFGLCVDCVNVDQRW